MLNIGNVIRTRRRAMDMTQDNLAEVLGVSVSAVSLWESGKTMPDMGLIPPLCSVLEVSADELFGIDIDKKHEEIVKIRKEARKYSDCGYNKEAIEILNNGLGRYPDSFDLMHDLMHANYYYAHGEDEGEAKEKAIDRAVELGERILEKCTDNPMRNDTVQILVSCYKNKNPERAEKLADSMSSIWTCREVLKTRTYKGKKAAEASQELIIMTMGIMCSEIWSLAVNHGDELGYTSDEKAKIHEKVIAILNTIFEDGDFGFGHTRLQDSEQPLAIYYAEQQDKEKCLEHLRAAANHAITFVKLANSYRFTHTSLILRGMKAELDFSFSGSSNSALLLKESMTDARYNFVRETEEFGAILSELDEYAGEWSKKE